MLTTWTGEEQRSRPMSARPRRAENAIYFLMDVSGEKNADIEAFPTVSLAWADNGDYRYALISGEAKSSELWPKMDQAWWEENDPTIRLLTVVPVRGEIWDSPNAVVSGAKMVIAAVTGSAPELGDNASVKM